LPCNRSAGIALQRAIRVYQAVIGFELWTAQQAPEALMKRALRKALGLT
jgi:shikimate 5-dehydrogenase